VDCLALPLPGVPFAKHRLAEAGDPLLVIFTDGLGVKSHLFPTGSIAAG